MLKAAARAVADLVYPPGLACGLCGAELPDGGALCPDCAREVASPYAHRCPGCGRGRDAAGLCHFCRRLGGAADRALAAFDYEGPIRRALIGFKFYDRTACRDFFAGAMASAVTAAGWAVDCVVPVPMHWLRRFARGYNQTELLARSVARALGRPMAAGVLIRPVYTRPTARRADAYATRADNARRSFRPGRGDLTGKTVLLVDDILTTGSTVRACAAILRGMGAASVVSVVAAAVPDRK